MVWDEEYVSLRIGVFVLKARFERLQKHAESSRFASASDLQTDFKHLVRDLYVWYGRVHTAQATYRSEFETEQQSIINSIVAIEHIIATRSSTLRRALEVLCTLATALDTIFAHFGLPKLAEPIVGAGAKFVGVAARPPSGTHGELPLLPPIVRRIPALPAHGAGEWIGGPTDRSAFVGQKQYGAERTNQSTRQVNQGNSRRQQTREPAPPVPPANRPQHPRNLGEQSSRPPRPAPPIQKNPSANSERIREEQAESVSRSRSAETINSQANTCSAGAPRGAEYRAPTSSQYHIRTDGPRTSMPPPVPPQFRKEHIKRGPR